MAFAGLLIAEAESVSIAAGADGLLIEVHPNPKEALGDGLQALTPANFSKLMDELRQIARCVGRTM